MNRKISVKYLVLICICIALILGCVVAGFCTLHTVKQNGRYRDKYSVALYIYTYHELPSNFITKVEAAAIKDTNTRRQYNMGGDTFYNREGHIDNPDNVRLVECDIYTGNCSIVNRGAERIVFFSDGSLVLYTADHYDTFTPITMWDINGTSYILFGATGAPLMMLIVVTTATVKHTRKNKQNSISQ